MQSFSFPFPLTTSKLYVLLANPLAMNDDCLTPLDVARLKGYNNVVRTIEVLLHLMFSMELVQ